MELAKDSSENLNIIYNFLNKVETNDDLLEKIMNEISQAKLKEDSFLSFKVDNFCVEKDESFKMWFHNYMKNLDTKPTKKIISMISGKEVEALVDTSPMITEPGYLVGSGIYISAIASESCFSYGLKSNENAPIGKEEAEVLKAGFEYLLSNPNHFDKNFNLIHFGDDNLINQILNPINNEFGDDEDLPTKEEFKSDDNILASNLNSISTNGIINYEIEDKNFHFMQFVIPSGTKGKFTLAKYKFGSCKKLLENIDLWKNDTKLETLIKKDSNLIPTTKSIGKLYNVFFALLEQKKADDKIQQIEKEFGEDKLNLLYSIVDGEQIPFKFYLKALNVVKRTLISFKTDDEKEEITKKWSDIRTALKIIKAYLIKEQRKKGENITIMEGLNPNETNVAYNCGRLFAIYESLQSIAQGNVNTNITDNYFPTAQSNPEIVFGRLAKLSNYHLSKLKDKPQLKVYFSKQILEIAEKIPYYPKTLKMQEQGMFALGYYHQRNENFKSKKELKEEGEENYE